MPIYTRELSIAESELEGIFAQLFKRMRVNAITGCFEWIGGKRHKYAKIRFNGRSVGVHRLMLACLYGELPKCIEASHLCHNPPCFNPYHLEPATHRENIRQKLSVASTICKWGHEYTPENTNYTKTGARICKQCGKDKFYEWRKENRDRMNEISRASYRRVGRKDRERQKLANLPFRFL